MKTFKVVVTLIFTLGMIVSFQNCSKQKFSSVDPEVKPQGGLDPLSCSAGQVTGRAQQLYHPNSCLKPVNYVDERSLALHINKLQKGIVTLEADMILAEEKNIYIEVATYIAPDTIRMNAVLQDGTKIPLVNICNISTYTELDNFTMGQIRPYSSTIVQFHVTLPVGTQFLEVDLTDAETFNYIGIWNLNDFSRALQQVVENEDVILRQLEIARNTCDEANCSFDFATSHLDLEFNGRRGGVSGNRGAILLKDLSVHTGTPLDTVSESYDGYNNTKESGYADPLAAAEFVCR